MRAQRNEPTWRVLWHPSSSTPPPPQRRRRDTKAGFAGFPSTQPHGSVALCLWLEDTQQRRLISVKFFTAWGIPESFSIISQIYSCRNRETTARSIPELRNVR